MTIAPPIPNGPIPSPRQLAWHELEFYGFLHFTVNTFTNREWGHGNESPSIFNPTRFDATQMAETAAEGGMKGLILTAKHHDGFCLWPSEHTEHSVKNSPWRGGKGDVVAEVAEACRRAGLKFGVYLSPWDRNHIDYATPAYLVYYRSQLRELMTRYGPLFEIWFDGANGGDGYYGGKHERRSIDGRTYYEWEQTFALVRELQPGACIFNPPGADIRWVGNEHGIAGDPCWHTYDPVAGAEQAVAGLNAGYRQGSQWFPAECDVSIRPGWFYHRKEDWLVRTPRNLYNLYLQSVGRGANLLLNLPPTPAGQIHPRDRANLLRFNRLLQTIFAHDLAAQGRVSANAFRGGSPEFGPQRLLEDDRGTYWTLDDGSTCGEVVFDFERPVTFNLIDLREAIQLGQRVESYAVDVWQDEAWSTIYQAESIGCRRLAPVPDQQTRRVRLRITGASACPAISRFSLYNAQVQQPATLQDWFFDNIFPRIH